MDAASAVALVEQLGLPVVLLALGALVAWRGGGALLAALVESYRERIADLEADREHFRARSEAAEDRTAELCASMIQALRGKEAQHEQ